MNYHQKIHLLVTNPQEKNYYEKHQEVGKNIMIPKEMNCHRNSLLLVTNILVKNQNKKKQNGKNIKSFL